MIVWRQLKPMHFADVYPGLLWMTAGSHGPDYS